LQPFPQLSLTAPRLYLQNLGVSAASVFLGGFPTIKNADQKSVDPQLYDRFAVRVHDFYVLCPNHLRQTYSLNIIYNQHI
jgi:hypothetical protein